MFFYYQKNDTYCLLPVDLIYALICQLGIRQSSSYLLYFPVQGLFLCHHHTLPLPCRQVCLLLVVFLLLLICIFDVYSISYSVMDFVNVVCLVYNDRFAPHTGNPCSASCDCSYPSLLFLRECCNSYIMSIYNNSP